MADVRAVLDRHVSIDDVDLSKIAAALRASLPAGAQHTYSRQAALILTRPKREQNSGESYAAADESTTAVRVSTKYG